MATSCLACFAVRQQRWNDAAHAAGVLSHYFTDVIQPLHTQVDQREKVLHGPIECSIYRSFDSILQGWQDDEMRIVFQLADRDGEQDRCKPAFGAGVLHAPLQGLTAW